MKRHIFSLLMLAFAVSSFAANEWKEYYTNGTVQILYRYTDCNDVKNGIKQQKVVFKFVNNGDKKVAITFGKTMTYTNTAAPITDETNFTVTVPAHQSTEGDCTTHDNALFIFSKHLDMAGRELKAFDLKNISVKTIE